MTTLTQLASTETRSVFSLRLQVYGSFLLMLLAALSLGACSGDDDGDGGTNPPPPPNDTTGMGGGGGGAVAKSLEIGALDFESLQGLEFQGARAVVYAEGVFSLLTATALHSSTDGALTWRETIAISSNFGGANSHLELGPNGNRYAFVHNSGFYHSADDGLTWTRTSASGMPTDAGNLGTTDLAVGTDGDVYVFQRIDNVPRLYRSADQGANFRELSGYPADGFAWEIAAYSDGALLMSSNTSVVRTSDDGDTWTTIKNDFRFVSKLVADPSTGRIACFEGQTPRGMYLGDANGLALRQRALGDPGAGVYPLQFEASGQFYVTDFTADNYGFLYRLRENQNSWLQMGNHRGSLVSLATSPNRTVAIDNQGVLYYLEADEAQWTTRALPPGGVLDFDFRASQHWAVLLGTQVVVSRDAGATWRMGLSIPNVSVHAIRVSPQDGRVFLGLGPRTPVVAELDLNGSSILQLEAVGGEGIGFRVTNIDVDEFGQRLASVSSVDRAQGYFAVRQPTESQYTVYVTSVGEAPGAIDQGTIEVYGYKFFNQRAGSRIESRQYFYGNLGGLDTDYTEDVVERSNGLDQFVAELNVPGGRIYYFNATDPVVYGVDTIMRVPDSQLPLSPNAAWVDADNRVVVATPTSLLRSRQAAEVRQVE